MTFAPSPGRTEAAICPENCSMGRVQVLGKAVHVVGEQVTVEVTSAMGVSTRRGPVVLYSSEVFRAYSEAEGEDMTGAPIRVKPDDREDLRFAVVMSGGVSLCVWMGGVAAEMDRLRRRESVYAALLDLLGSTARFDVIAGTSAGGLNGVLLGAAIGYGSSLESLRQVWLNRAAFDDLLRRPFDRNPPSLLKGDEYFYGQVAEALRDIRSTGSGETTTAVDTAESDPDVDIQLFVTTTLVRARSNPRFDDFDQLVPESTNRGLFRFRGSDFACDETSVLRLALAARSSAAHPAGFEAAFCPIGTTVPPDESVPERPDMAPVANWKGSRFVLDGGILVNRPVAPALDAILSQPARREVRRVMTYVVPNPGPALTESEDDLSEPPTLLRTAGAGFDIPRNQSIAEDLDRLHQERGRALVDRAWEEQLEEVADPVEAAKALYPAYLAVERASRVRQIASLLRLPNSVARTASAWRWSRQKVEAALNAVLTTQSLPPPGGFPGPGQTFVMPWPWGVSLLEEITLDGLDLLGGILRVTEPDDPDAPPDSQRGIAGFLKQELFRIWSHLRRIREWDRDYWETRSGAINPDENPYDWASEALATWMTALSAWAADHPLGWPAEKPLGWPPSDDSIAGDDGDHLSNVALRLAHVLIAIPQVGNVLNTPARGQGTEADRLRGLLNTILASVQDFLNELAADSVRDDSLALPRALDGFFRWQLAAQVLRAPVKAGTSATAAEVRVMQISADTPNAFDARSLGSQKLTGFQLAHFGAFYKRSWRANDWMWGRLDGAVRLVQILLDPARLRKLGYTAQSAFEAIEPIALGTEAGPGAENPLVQAVLAQDRQVWAGRARKELAFLDQPSGPRSFPDTALWIARRIQLHVLLQELPVVASEAKVDQEGGGAQRPGTAAFLEAYKRSKIGNRLLPRNAEGVFRACIIGQERIDGEQGTDAFMKTASQAAAVGISAASGERSGLGALRGAVASARGYALAMYSLVRAAVNKSKVIAALTVAALSLAAALVVLAAGGKATGPLVGVSIIVGGVLVGVAAFRNGRANRVIALALGFLAFETFLVMAVRGFAGLAVALAIALGAALFFGAILDGRLRLPLAGWRRPVLIALFLGGLLGMLGWIWAVPLDVSITTQRTQSCGSLLTPHEFKGDSATSSEASNCQHVLQQRRTVAVVGALVVVLLGVGIFALRKPQVRSGSVMVGAGQDRVLVTQVNLPKRGKILAKCDNPDVYVTSADWIQKGRTFEIQLSGSVGFATEIAWSVI